MLEIARRNEPRPPPPTAGLSPPSPAHARPTPTPPRSAPAPHPPLLDPLETTTPRHVTRTREATSAPGASCVALLGNRVDHPTDGRSVTKGVCDAASLGSRRNA